MKKNDIIIIKDNLEEVMNDIGFDPEESKRFSKLYSGTMQTVFAIWTDSDGQEYATIDLCVEIPLQCCEPHNRPELIKCAGCDHAWSGCGSIK